MTAGYLSSYSMSIKELLKALEGAGVAFTNDDEPGVKLRRGS